MSIVDTKRRLDAIWEVEELTKGKPDLLHGTLELLILKTLSAGSSHGWAIAKQIEQMSDEVLQIGQGSLYPALYRLEDGGWISSKWGVSELGRRAKFYSITRRGSRHLSSEEALWRRFTSAVDRVLSLPPAAAEGDPT